MNARLTVDGCLARPTCSPLHVESDPGLAIVVGACGRLPEAIKARIVAMVKVGTEAGEK